MKITILLSLMMFATQLSNAGAASPSLVPGTWWTLKGSYQQSYSGTGGQGQASYTETGNYTDSFLVRSIDSSTMSIRMQINGAYSCIAQGTFAGLSCGPPNGGTFAETVEWTIYTSTLLVASFTRNGQAETQAVGHPVWLIQNPSKLTDGGKTPFSWCVPTSDVKGCSITDVQASVSTQQVNLKGNMAKVWVVTYTGQTIGNYQNSEGAYSTGPETDSWQYDPVYGIFLGGSRNQKFNGTQTGGAGTWTEIYSENDQFVDSSLTFTATATINLAPSANLYITVDGVKYASGQLPKTFSWFIGSTHTLALDSNIQGSSGVQYVFVQWNDGSAQNSRSLVVTQDTTLTATYKTQYQLTVVSDVGNPLGTGWYDAGTQATFSVASPQPGAGLMGTLGGKTIFQRWSGDSNAASPSATITMDGPKTITATWAADNTQPYAVLGSIAAALVIVAALVIFMRRK